MTTPAPNVRPKTRVNRDHPGPKKRKPRRTQSLWKTALIGVGLIAGALFIAVVLTGEGVPEYNETAPVDVTGGSLAPIPDPASGAEDPSLGATAPNATGVDFLGDAQTLLNDDGGTIITFLAHWCPHCQVEVPVLVDHLGGGALPDDVKLIAVPTSTDITQGNYPPSAWLDAEDWEFPVLVDSPARQLAQAYGVTAFPAFVVVGPDGTVRIRTSGELPEAMLDQLVAAAQS